MLAVTIGTALHGVWCYLFIVYFGWGVVGGGMAMATTYIIIFTFTTVHSHFFIPKIKQALFWPTIYSFTGWGEYLAISKPATVMMCADVWAWEIVIILAGYISVEAQAAQVLSSCIYDLGNISKGMAEATSSLIGNSIGENKV